MAAAELTDADLALLRDEVGTAEPPDGELYTLFDEVGSWRRVALRVLKRRRAAAVGTGDGSVTSLTVPGAVSLGFARADLASLDRQIARLTAEALAEEAGQDADAEAAGITSTRLRRRDRVR